MRDNALANCSTSGAIEFFDRRTERCRRQHLRAVETLARVRKLNLPAIQVNVGQSQINVAGSAARGIVLD